MTDFITGGKVTYEDAVKHDGYADPQYAPSRRAAAEIAFDVPADGNGAEILDAVFALAVDKVNQILGKKEVALKAEKKTRAKATKETVVDASPAGSDKAALEAAAGLKAAEPVVEEDSLDDLLGAQAPVPITDAELAKAAQNKNAQMKASDPNFSVKIRALVVEYAGAPPKKITDVPVSKRQEFLDKLRDLK